MADISERGDLTKSFGVESKNIIKLRDDLRPLDSDEVRIHPLASSPSVVSVDDFARSSR